MSNPTPSSLRPRDPRRIARAVAGSLLSGLALIPASGVAQTAPGATGFPADVLPGQAICEAKLMELPSSASWREHHRTITREPHPTGSEANRRVADYLATTMERAGLEVERAEYDVYLPVLEGLVNEIEIITPVRRVLPNREIPVDEDPHSGHPDLLPGWNAFSGSGDVTGEVVYANFGRKEDYEQLDSMGVDLRGKIVIARYGGNFRGYKVKFAEERGAAGVVMFNDPGFASGDEYPLGPQMNASTIQRGSALTLDWWGDPLTPFEPAYPLDGDRHVERLDPSTVGLHTIPVLPIGFGAAEEILTLMTGESAPAGWGGGLDVPYRLTGGPGLTLRVNVQQKLDFVRIQNVIGTVRGTEFPDEWVLFGSHYDPWGFGAHDPNGGTSTLVELAEALGELARNGCAPRRSIRIAHWDAEEYGIIGSSEWVEDYRDELQSGAVAYFNADAAISGPNFSSSSAPSLKQPIMDATHAVPYPGTDGSVYDRWAERAGGDGPVMGNLGGGSDHVGFYAHAGVPSAGASFGGSNGIYHSNYDTFAFFERFSDPDFVWGPTLARLHGVLALRFGNADVLPYDVTRYGIDARRHAEDLARRAVELGLGEVALRDFHAAADRVIAAGERFEQARDAAVAAGRTSGAEGRERIERVNEILISLEKSFLHPEGLQGRPWIRSLYASPDPFSGYASWMFPALRYEIETRNPGELARWEEIHVGALERLISRLDQAAALLNGD